MVAMPLVMGRALSHHNNVMRKAAWTHYGFVIGQEGDSYLLAFREALDAVAFCLQVGVRVQGAGLRVQGVSAGFGVQGLGCRVLGFRVQGNGYLGFRVMGTLIFSFRVQGIGVRVQGNGYPNIRF